MKNRTNVNFVIIAVQEKVTFRNILEFTLVKSHTNANDEKVADKYLGHTVM